MTDLRHHLPMILRIARRHLHALGDEASTDLKLAGVCDQLVAQLPASYGVDMVGMVSGDSTTVGPFDLIIGDRTVPSEMPETVGVCPVRQVLAVIMFGNMLGEEQLGALLALVAALKRLRPTRQPRAVSRAGAIPREIVPLGLIICCAWQLPGAADRDGQCLALHRLLTRWPITERVDSLLATSLTLTYQNPVMTGQPPEATGMVREPPLAKPRQCYICKTAYRHAHWHHDWLCPRCGDANMRQRLVMADLHGRVALVTGGRIQIGHTVALRLLRAGARVIVTSRFPHDAAQRFAAEPDTADWSDHLQIARLDLLRLPEVLQWCTWLEATEPHLDILINNAAQTVRHPPEFYAHLLPYEQVPVQALPVIQCEPIFRGMMTGEHLSGVLLKDFVVAPW